MTAPVYGNKTWWGFSPAQNFLDILSRHEVEYGEKKDLYFLVVGSADGRHILKTISRLRDLKIRLHFIIIENDLETIARQLLLIDLAVTPSLEYGLQDQSEIFMELYGNSLIRDTTGQYLVGKANEYIKWITDDEYCTSSRKIWNFSNLKFKERDQLEDIFQFWQRKNDIFDISKYWDERLRNHLGLRYDTRDNAYDWSYSMQLKEKASIINWHEYKSWRETGVAFKFRDESAYEVANKTMASGILLKKNGEHLAQQGYWGDILNSPYITYGSESDDKSLFKRHNNIHTKTSTDVSLFNITSIIHEIKHGKEYIKDEVTIKEIPEEDSSITKSNPLDNVEISFLPVGSIADITRKSKFKHKFDVVLFSNSMVHRLNESIQHLFANDALLMIESTKFMLELKDDMHEEYGRKITGMAKSAGCHEIKQFLPDKHSYAVFKFNA